MLFAVIVGSMPLHDPRMRYPRQPAGAASRQSIGTTVFGGMLAATILSLLCVPVFYAVIEQLRDRRASKDAAPAAPLKTTAPAE